MFWLQNKHLTTRALSGKHEKNLCTLKESQIDISITK